MHIKYLLFFIPLFIFAKDFNISQFKEGSRIDIVSSDNGNVLGINMVTKESEISYTPKQDTLTFSKPIKIIKSKYGNIFLYDLSKNNLFLNALIFDKIEIDANLKEIKIMGIADEKYFKIEDNFKLPITNTILLKTICTKIDLKRLKYFVIISPLKNSPVKSITFKKSRIKNISNLPLGTWVWKPEKLSLSKLKRYNFKNIYVQVKDGFNKALKRIKDYNGTIYGLNGSASDIFNYEHLLKDIEKLSVLKKQFPNIIGYQVDIEPYLLPDFKENRDEYLKKYIKTLIALKESVHKHNLKFSVTIPFWFDNLYLNYQNIGFKVVDIADEVVLMSYRSNLDKVINISSTLLRYAQLRDKKVRLGLELMKIDDEIHTVFKIDKKSSCLTSKGFNKECLILEKIREYKILGKNISFYNQLEKLKNLKNYSVPFSSFDGFVLHYFSILK